MNHSHAMRQRRSLDETCNNRNPDEDAPTAIRFCTLAKQHWGHHGAIGPDGAAVVTWANGMKPRKPWTPRGPRPRYSLGPSGGTMKPDYVPPQREPVRVRINGQVVLAEIVWDGR